MIALLGATAPGVTERGLTCAICQGECAKPLEHVISERSDSSLLFPDDKVQLYAEQNRHGRRLRLIQAYKGGTVRTFIDDMGPESDFKVEPFAIPSAGDGYVTEWNTVGECFAIAGDIHDNGGLVKNREHTRRATGAEWAAQYAQQRAFMREELAARSTYGAGGHFQRDRSWRK